MKTQRSVTIQSVTASYFSIFNLKFPLSYISCFPFPLLPCIAEATTILYYLNDEECEVRNNLSGVFNPMLENGAKSVIQFEFNL